MGDQCSDNGGAPSFYALYAHNPYSYPAFNMCELPDSDDEDDYRLSGHHDSGTGILNSGMDDVPQLEERDEESAYASPAAILTMCRANDVATSPANAVQWRQMEQHVYDISDELPHHYTGDAVPPQDIFAYSVQPDLRGWEFASDVPPSYPPSIPIEVEQQRIMGPVAAVPSFQPLPQHFRVYLYNVPAPFATIDTHKNELRCAFEEYLRRTVDPTSVVSDHVLSFGCVVLRGRCTYAGSNAVAREITDSKFFIAPCDAVCMWSGAACGARCNPLHCGRHCLGEMRSPCDCSYTLVSDVTAWERSTLAPYLPWDWPRHCVIARPKQKRRNKIDGVHQKLR